MPSIENLTRRNEFLNDALETEKKGRAADKQYYRDRIAVLESQLENTADAVWFYDTSLPKSQLNNLSCPAVVISPDLLSRLLQSYSEGQLVAIYKQSANL